MYFHRTDSGYGSGSFSSNSTSSTSSQSAGMCHLQINDDTSSAKNKNISKVNTKYVAMYIASSYIIC